MSYIQEIINLMIMRTGWLAVFTSSETYMPSERAYLCVVEDAIIQRRSNSSIVRVWVKLRCEKALLFFPRQGKAASVEVWFWY